MEMVKEHIVNWLLTKNAEAEKDGFVIGVSGGVDSAVTSTLCAMTKKTVIVVNIPINEVGVNTRALLHINWLLDKYTNVKRIDVHMFNAFYTFKQALNSVTRGNELAMANLQSRLRMAALYAEASTRNLLVCGTGNKVEDYGVGFFTKYGDGGVDISPIADLLKSEVRELGRHIDVIEEIVTATPTDGLWPDGRTDTDQIGASYDELEWAMEYLSNHKLSGITERQKKVIDIYCNLHSKNRHKMEVPPICAISDYLK